jgi:hypothetical protein
MDAATLLELVRYFSVRATNAEVRAEALVAENEQLRAQVAKHAANEAAEEQLPHYAHDG